jgi:DNA polymerase-3 subunit delta'
VTELQHEPVWNDLLGQPEAIEQLETAVRNRASGLHHAWLLTGPPGSGRSNLAVAFAAALLCENSGCGSCKSCSLVLSGSHPDVSVLSTEKVTIAIDEVRALVSSSNFGASMGRYRIMVIEDADRMAERSSNVLLKALEEPPAGTIWLLCAPSEADMLPTIRSRVRKVGLKVPSIHEVARILEREGVEPKLALLAAAEAQSHIGMARRLATSSDARSRRRETLTSALSIKTVTDAVNTADRWLDIAKKDAEALTLERDGAEKASLLRSMGLEAGAAVPASLKTEVRQLEEGQKRRATRSLRDGIDRILVDLLALYRDVLALQLQTGSALVNADLATQLQDLAISSSPAKTIDKLDAIGEARHRISANVKDLLVLESLAISLRRAGE